MTQDHFTVTNLLSSYNQYIDGNKEKEFGALFSPPNSTMSSKIEIGDQVFDSAEKIGKFFTHVRGLCTASTMHIESNICIGRANNWFTNFSSWQCITDGKIVSYGVHEDLILVVGTDAYFINRKIKVVWRAPASGGGGGGGSRAKDGTGATSAADAGGRRRGERRDREILDPTMSVYVSVPTRTHGTQAELRDLVTSEFVSKLSVNVRKARSIGRGGAFVLLDSTDAVKRALDGAKQLGDGSWRVEVPKPAAAPRSDRVSNK